MKYLLIIVLLVASGFVAGCTGESKEKVSPVIFLLSSPLRQFPRCQTQKPGTVTTMVTTRTIPSTTRRQQPPQQHHRNLSHRRSRSMERRGRFYPDDSARDGPGIVKFTKLRGCTFISHEFSGRRFGDLVHKKDPAGNLERDQMFKEIMPEVCFSHRFISRYNHCSHILTKSGIVDRKCHCIPYSRVEQSTVSISTGEIFSPPLLIISFSGW